MAAEPPALDAPAQKQRILVTGAAGAIGKRVASSLAARGHFVRGFDLRPAPGVAEPIVGSLLDAAAIARAVAGVDTVIHLAATPDIAEFPTDLVPNNIVGTYNVLEAAAAARVRRILLASTLRVTSFSEQPDTLVTPATPYGPSDYYAVSKVCCEQMGNLLARRTKIAVLALRLGWFLRHPEDVKKIAKHGPPRIYLSHRDAQRFFTLAVECPWRGPEKIPFAALYVMSARAADCFDPAPAEQMLGYRGQDTFPDGMDFADAAG